ncbi:MAG: hypothetical protein LBR70_04595 [Lactobacillaceae bacterium]|nr:hypothetical protein [Lactobacillaceae bacterium]
MQVVEEFLEGRNKDQSLCEDGIFVSNDFIAIIDGATAKSKVQYGGKSSGRVAMEKVKAAIGTIPANATAYEAVEVVTKYIADWYKSIRKYEHLKANSVERPTASTIIYSKNKKELWCVGDCHALVDNEYINNDKLIDKVMMEARSLYLQTEILKGKTVEELCEKDTGWDFIFPLLERQGMFQNREEYTEFNYGVFDGFSVPKSLIRVVKIPNAKFVVMASDGYPKLYNILEEAEKHLKKVLKEDPLCFTSNKSFKPYNSSFNSFDDRSFISIKV